MKKKPLLLGGITFLGLLLLFSSCKEEEFVGPPTANIFFSIVDKKVAFTAITKYSDSWVWDFGDGQTSTEEAPVHEYEQGGVYTIKMIATGPKGSDEATVEVSLALSPFEMLTGGAASPNGKTWKISAGHSANDAITLADPDLTVIQPVPEGALGLFLGLGEEYEDEFTFKADGSYSHDTKNGGAFAGLVFTIVNQLDIVAITAESQEFGFATTAYTPEDNATFTFVEKEDYNITAVALDGATTYDLAFNDVATLDFSGTEFIGVMDFTRKCIVQELTPDKMRLVMFMAATQDAHFSKPALAVIFTFEVVK